jgi:hypothetical protein
MLFVSAEVIINGVSDTGVQGVLPILEEVTDAGMMIIGILQVYVHTLNNIFPTA